MSNTNAVIGGVMTGAVKEDEILTASGQLTIDDVDGEREFMAFSYSGNYGNLSLTKDGAWTYKSDNWDSWQGGRSYIDEITIAAKDGTFATITITVNGTNDAPTITTPYGSASVNEEGTISGSLGVTDVDYDSLSYSTVGAEHGTVSLWGDHFTYTPNTDFYGWDSFTVVVDDGHGGTVTTSVGLLVGNDWDAPFGTDKSVTIAEDGNHTVMVDDFGFSDYKDAGSQINDFDAVIISAVSGDGKLWFGNAELDLSGGAVMISTDDIEAGKLVWIPDADASGQAHITFNVKDGPVAQAQDNNTSKDANTLTINVAAVNDEPSFTAGANQTVTEDSGSHVVAYWATLISAGPSNESGQTLSFDVSDDNAALFEEGPALAADGTLTYKLATDAFGSATVTVVLQDSGSGQGDNDNTSAPVTFTITAEGTNDAPSGAGKTIIYKEDSGSQVLGSSVFGFSDKADAPDANGLSEVIIDKISGKGTFMLGKAEVHAGDVIDATALASLTFQSARNDFGTGYASLKFRLVDDGGTDNVGSDTEAVAHTLNFNVTDVTDKFLGTAAKNVLKGTVGHDVLDGGRGNDRLTGLGGSDTFVFSRGYGKDVITDFDFKGADHDTLDLRKLVGVDSFKDLMAHHIEKSGAGVLITGDHGDQVTLSQVKIGNLAAADFLF
jgi:VCBS repeat-containing protein